MTIEECNWQQPGGLAAARIICAFLAEIGIAVNVGKPESRQFFPGMAIIEGGIAIDPDGEPIPGDLLHEAGHIAVVEPERRATLCDVGNDEGEEMAAWAWSVAAARACGIPLDVLFHPQGHKGWHLSLIEDFENGRTFGVPLLAWWGLTTEAQFPAMTRWLR